MPKPADFRDRVFKPTIFNRISEIAAAGSDGGRELITLHQGDTWHDLPPELNQPLEHEPWDARYSRYGDTLGEPVLRERLIAKLQTRNRLPVTDPGQIQLTHGAIGGLFLIMQQLLETGDEILVLSPEWTYLKVVAQTARVELVEAPFFDRVQGLTGDEIIALIEPFCTERTRAIYFNNPNNPTGTMLRPLQIQAIADFAHARDLWVISDEAYEDFVWADVEYVSIGSLPGMFERTVSVFSFSKSCAAAGLRLGYVAAPLGVIATLNPGQVGVCYEPNRPAQVAAIRGVERAAAIRTRLRDSYRAGLAATLDHLREPHLAPEGAYYVFIDLRERWAGLSETEKVERMIMAGVTVSPGEYFGAAYDGWVRFCYTAEQPCVVAEAAKRVSDL
ncbi:MAG: pyridoxal phosphate-dependent aminotransferase [bacterium]|nr:pyridoxal phosphate-dependent aminotransferase [bacterium]